MKFDYTYKSHLLSSLNLAAGVLDQTEAAVRLGPRGEAAVLDGLLGRLPQRPVQERPASGL